MRRILAIGAIAAAAFGGLGAGSANALCAGNLLCAGQSGCNSSVNVCPNANNCTASGLGANVCPDAGSCSGGFVSVCNVKATAAR